MAEEGLKWLDKPPPRNTFLFGEGIRESTSKILFGNKHWRVKNAKDGCCHKGIFIVAIWGRSAI